MPTLPLFAEPTLLVWSASLSGVSDDPGGLGPLWNMRLWALLIRPHRAHADARDGRRDAADARDARVPACARRRAHSRRSGGIGRRASLRG